MFYSARLAFDNERINHQTVEPRAGRSDWRQPTNDVGRSIKEEKVPPKIEAHFSYSNLLPSVVVVIVRAVCHKSQIVIEMNYYIKKSEESHHHHRTTTTTLDNNAAEPRLWNNNAGHLLGKKRPSSKTARPVVFMFFQCCYFYVGMAWSRFSSGRFEQTKFNCALFSFLLAEKRPTKTEDKVWRWWYNRVCRPITAAPSQVLPSTV